VEDGERDLAEKGRELEPEGRPRRRPAPPPVTAPRRPAPHALLRAVRSHPVACLSAPEEASMDVLAIFNGSPNGRRYGAGDVIFNVGDAAHEMYVLLEGNVDIKVDGRTIEE